MKVVSSNISDIDHDGTNLIVEYISGVKYKYKNVPTDLFESFKTAESKGRFMNAEIKGKFEYEKV